MTAIADLLTGATDPGRLVARDRSRSYTLAEFRASVGALAQTLAAQPGQRWLLCEANSYRFAIGLMALLHSGKTVLLPPNAQPGTVAGLMARCDGALGAEAGAAIDCDARAAFAFGSLDENRCVIEVATSGSTGESLIVAKPLRCFERELAVQAGLWRESLAAATLFATVSHQHIYGLLFRVLLPLLCQRPFWTHSHQYPEQLAADIRYCAEPAVLISSPAHLSRLPPALDLSPLREYVQMIVSSGGPLPLSASRELAQRVGRIPVEIFGSTETGGVAWRQQRLADQPWRMLPGVDLSADADSGQLCVKSDFCADAAGVMMGDRVQFAGDGEFTLIGRVDRIVKLEEKRLSLTAMERDLAQAPWVQGARLAVLPGRRQQLAAVVELSPEGVTLLQESGKRALNQALKEHLLHHYERVLLPRKWRYFEKLPVNSQGKLPLADIMGLFEDHQ